MTMMNLESKATKAVLVFVTSAVLVLAGCGRSTKFDGGNGSKTAAVEHDGANADIVVDETNAEGGKGGAGGGGGDDVATSNPKDDDAAVREAQTDVGIKNFLQINATFSALTGVPTTQAAVLAAFNGVKTQLPSGNSIKTFSASVQVAVSKLAVAYCDVALNDATLRANIVPNFDFAGTVATALNAEGQDTLINGLTASFWGDMTSGVDQTASKQMLKTLAGQLITGLETGNAVQSHAIASGMCTAALASSPVTFL